MRSILSLLCAGAFGLLANLAEATVETLDRGALSGSAEGRIWSHVVDQVGNTHGAAEVWHLGPARMGAVLHLTVDTPFPEQMRIGLPWMTADGGLVELSVTERTPTGVRLVTGPIRQPDLNPDVTVVLYPLRPSMDVTYRIQASWEGGVDAPTDPGAPRRWDRYENGQLMESLSFEGQGANLTIVFYDAQGRAYSRLRATDEGGTIRARSATRTITMTLRGEVLSYSSTDHDGSNRWDGEFR